MARARKNAEETKDQVEETGAGEPVAPEEEAPAEPPAPEHGPPAAGEAPAEEPAAEEPEAEAPSPWRSRRRGGARGRRACRGA